MRSLALLGLLALSVLPLAAHDHGPWRGRGPRRVVVLETRPGAYGRCDDRPWDNRYERYDRHDRYGRYDREDDDRWEGRTCRDDRPRYRAYDDDVVVVRPRPLAPPWRSRIVFRFGW